MRNPRFSSKIRLALGVLSLMAIVFMATALMTPASVKGSHGGIHLIPIATGFNNPVGIDHHQPTNQVVMSVHYPSGSPYNFELVAADGSRIQFSSISGYTDEVKIATVRKGCCQGGFEVGELFTGTGVPGHIARISPDGSIVQNPWVILPGETGLMRGSLFQDRFCVFGGDLIVVTTKGGVWRVTSGGVATKLTTITVLGEVLVHLEGVTTVPNDASKYGPWAGKILAGAEQQNLLWAIDASGVKTPYALGIKPEDIDIIPANQNFFGVDFGGRTLWGAPPLEFAGMIGDVLVTQEDDGILWHVRWNGAAFEKTEIARVTHWEHVTFSTAGLPDILPIDPIELDPPTDVNPAGTDHTITARIIDPHASVPPGRRFRFEVTAGPNMGQVSDPGECAVNPNCTTDDSDAVSWTYTSDGRLGTDTIEACFIDDDCTEHCAEATKQWVDGTAPEAGCLETVNPHGKKVPPAGSTTLPGPKGGQNEDGFYKLQADDNFDREPEIFLIDLGSGTVFGPFASGTNIKYTEANGATPGQKKIGSGNGQAGAVLWHITGTGDAAVYAVDDSGNRSDLMFCRVPPPPK